MVKKPKRKIVEMIELESGRISQSCRFMFSNDSINNGKEIVISYKLVRFDVVKLRILSELTMLFVKNRQNPMAKEEKLLVKAV